MACTAAIVSRLQFVRHISTRNASSTDTHTDPSITHMCALSADELLLAYSYGPLGLRAVSLRSDDAGEAVYESIALRHVHHVAYDAHTDTLLLLMRTPNAEYLQLVSLPRNAREWVEVQRLDTAPRGFNFHMALCDSRVLLIGGIEDTLSVFNVSASHILHDAGRLHLQSRAYGLACSGRGGDTLVALSYRSSVSLQRLASLPLRLEQLASAYFTHPQDLLFRGDLLLVAPWNSITRTDVIASLRVSGNAFTEQRVLLDAQAGVIYFQWAIAGDRLVLSNWNDDLLVYNFI